MSLERFRKAQAAVQTGQAVAVSELRAGQKSSHWIWYIFPQLRILGKSSTAQHYGIENSKEAREYLLDAGLSRNLAEAMAAVVDQLERGARLDVLMGGEVDSLKLVSCATLFARTVEGAQDNLNTATVRKIHELTGVILREAERQGYPECESTRDALCSENDGQNISEFLGHICVKFGYCLSNSVNEEIARGGPYTPDDIAHAVLKAAGLDPGSELRQFRAVQSEFILFLNR